MLGKLSGYLQSLRFQNTNGTGSDIIASSSSVLSGLFFLFSAIYFLITASDLGIYDASTSAASKSAYWFIVAFLLVLPSYHKQAAASYISMVPTILFLLVVLILEVVLARPNAFHMYVAFYVFYRTTVKQSTFDSIVLCIAYSASDVADGRYWSEVELLTGRLFMWSLLVLGLVCSAIQRQMTARMRDNIRLLEIFKEKAEQQLRLADFVVRAHLSDDLVDSMLLKNKSSAKQANKRSASSGPGPTSLLEAARETEIFFNSVRADNKLPEAYMVETLQKMERCFSVVIAFKVCLGIEEHEASAANSQTVYDVHALIDNISLRHRMATARRFGTTWIGCTGFFDYSWESNNEHCYRAVIMACEVVTLVERLGVKLCCAIDCGSVVGGFLNGPYFDILGPEVRWILQMTESTNYFDVIISPVTRRLIQRYSIENRANAILFEQTALHPVWQSKGTAEVVYKIANTKELSLGVRMYEDEVVKQGRISLPIRANAAPPMTWSEFYEALNERPPQLPTNYYGRRRRKSRTRIEQNITLSERIRILFLDNPVFMNSRGGGPAGSKRGGQAAATSDGRQTQQLQQQQGVSSSTADSMTQMVWDFLISYFTASWYQFVFKLTILEKLRDIDDMVPLPESLEADIEKKARELYESDYLLWFFMTLYQFDFRASFGLLIGTEKRSSRRHRGTNGATKTAANARRYVQSAAAADDDGDKDQDSVEKRLVEAADGAADGTTAADAAVGSGRSIGLIRIPSGRSSQRVDPGLSSSPSTPPPGNKWRYRLSIRSTVSTIYTAASLLSDCLKLLLGTNRHPNSTDDDDKESTESQSFTFNFILGDAAQNNAARIKIMTKRLMTSRLFPHVSGGPYVALNFFFSSMAIYMFFQSILVLESSKAAAIPGMIAVLLHVIVPLLFEGASEEYYALPLAFILRVVMFFLVPPYNVIESTDANFISFTTAAPVILYFGLWIPIGLRQSLRVNMLDLILSLFVTIYYTEIRAQHGLTRGILPLLVLLIMSVLLLSFFSLECLAVFSYHLEHRLVPSAQRLYVDQFWKTRGLLSACSKLLNSNPDKRESMMMHLHQGRLQRYRVVAINIKAAELLPGLVDVDAVVAFMRDIDSIIDTCINDAGFTKVTSFSGLNIAVIPEIRIAEGANTTGAAELVSRLQQKIDNYNRMHDVNVAMVAGVAVGPAIVGYLGRTKFRFDISGPTRDMALSMAFQPSDEAVFVAESDLLEEFKSIFSQMDSFTDVLVEKSNGKERLWLKIERPFKSGVRLEDFDYISLIGRGGYGSVHLVNERSSGVNYAVKAIPRKQGAPISKFVRREFAVLQRIRHANVVAFKFCIVSPTRIYLVMDFVRGGNLRQIVNRDRPTVEQLKFWFAELTLALEYVHSLRIIHRDVKPANCIIDEYGHLKLADFGLAKTTASEATDNPDDDVLNSLKKVIPLKMFSTEGSQISDLTANMTNGGDHEEAPVKMLLLEKDPSAATSAAFSTMGYHIRSISKILDASFSVAGMEVIGFCLDEFIEPSSDSAEILRTIHAAWCRNIPIVAILNNENMILRARLLDAGAKAVISKSKIGNYCDAITTMVTSCRRRRTRRSNSRSREITFRHDSTSRMGVEAPFLRPESKSHSSAHLVLDDPSSRQLTVAAGGKGSGLSGAVDSKEFKSKEGQVQGQVQGQVGEKEKVSSSVYDQLSSRSVLSNRGGALPSESGPDRFIRGAVGTLAYMSPEIISSQTYSTAGDWWAFGVTIYECIVGTHLWKGETNEELMSQILSGSIDVSYLTKQSKALEDFVLKLLKRYPEDRLGANDADEVKSHAFFADLNFSQLADMNPPCRPGTFVFPPADKNDRAAFYGEIDEELNVRLSDASFNIARNNSSLSGQLASFEKKGLPPLTLLNKFRPQPTRRPKREDMELKSALRKRWVKEAKPGTTSAARDTQSMATQYYLPLPLEALPDDPSAEEQSSQKQKSPRLQPSQPQSQPQPRPPTPPRQQQQQQRHLSTRSAESIRDTKAVSADDIVVVENVSEQFI